MTATDTTRFAHLMMVLQEVFGGPPLTDLRTELYFDSLRDLPIEEVEKGVRLCRDTCTYFPKPVEIRQAVEGLGGDEAAREWGMLVREISSVGYTMRRQPDLSPTAMEAVRVVFGNWHRACGANIGAGGDTGPESMGWRKQFIAAYGEAKRRESVALLDAAPSLSGLIEGIKTWERSNGDPARANRPQLVVATRKASGE